jgi:hypothetical protein
MIGEPFDYAIMNWEGEILATGKMKFLSDG